ncbi:MAG: acyl-[acyl-carrier-protein] thioesterase [Clostridiales bacterium]|nr:acyl-[acyl-carrier-protein] thioesterase [Clostridiales bacterium]
MQSVLNEEILVKSYEVDCNKKTKLYSFFNYMQEAAFNHACSLGAGYEDMKKQKFLWVLSRVKIEVIRYPEWGEKIYLETWPKGTNRLFELRDFIFRNERNEKVALATSAWLVLDSNNMKPQKVQTLPFALPDNEGKYALNEELGKIESQSIFEFEIERTATYSDIDVNQHVNNAKYVEWIQDCFSEEAYINKHIKSLQLNYLSQTRLGQRVIIKIGNYKGNLGISYVEAIIKESSNKVFQSIIEWE